MANASNVPAMHFHLVRVSFLFRRGSPAKKIDLVLPAQLRNQVIGAHPYGPWHEGQDVQDSHAMLWLLLHLHHREPSEASERWDQAHDQLIEPINPAQNGKGDSFSE
jgi:hypothetical protein